MNSPAYGIFRVARGGVVAVACTMLALGGHAAVGGEVPSVRAALVVGCLLGTCFVLLADRQRAFPPILAAALVSQVVFHTAFTLTGAHAVHGELGTPLAFPDLPMVVGHVVAAAAMAALLAYGEAVVWSLFHAFRLVLVPRVELPPPSGRLPVPCAAGGPGPVGEVLLARVHPRRGPPVPAGL